MMYAPFHPTDAFHPTEPIRLRHRLALADLEIVWDDDGQDDVILGIIPVFTNLIRETTRSAAYDLSCSLRMIGDDHPKLRKVCHWLAARSGKFGLGA